MDYNKLALKFHEEHQGKIEVIPKAEISNRDDLSIAYTPGVAEPCRKIAENKEDVYRYTAKGNLVAVVTDGTAVLGLGNIGPEAGMPVMEGKCVLFKQFGNVDAFPICLNTTDVDEIVETVARIAPTFGGINLEDIAAPRCFEVEEKLKKRLDIPVFHDDQHGTAIVLLAALINALKVVDKKAEELKVIINGAGSAGTAIGKLLMEYGIKNVVFCDSKGIVTEKSANNEAKRQLAQISNPEHLEGTLADAMVNDDVFVGVSIGNCVTEEMVKSMNRDAIVFALANPVPEIMPEKALAAGARIMGTGRSDYPNQINNVLVFPGVFRGALDCRAREISEGMKLAAAEALASLVETDKLKEEYIIVSPFDERAARTVAEAVSTQARKEGLARK
ncbi:MAG: NADP-dependent malic enzyme [Erysipelotrichaceae bacterium]|nr:NADP-dependent malic enzyme [Erysipelotrichaceae bacterium]